MILSAMDVPLLVAGGLLLFAAAVHGGLGEKIVVRRLSTEVLPSSRFGGPRMTKAMIHVSWHLATAGFLTAAVAALLAGSALDGDSARAMGMLAAGAATAFAAIALGIGAAYNRSARSLFRHPAPALLSLTAALAWWGAL